MRSTYLIGAALLFAVGFSHAALALSVRTSLDEVTVYPAGARVLRVGQAELPAGAQKILFEGLPAGLREDSLRLKVEGPKGTTVYGMNLREAFSDAEQMKRQADLNVKIQALEDQRIDLADQMSAYKSEMDILKALAEKSAAKAGEGPGAKVAELAASVKTVGTRLEALAAATRKDERAQRELDKKLAAMKSELAQGGSSQTSSRVAEAELELAEAGSCRFELAYFVDQAGWSPRYDLRLRAADKEPKVELDFLAEVRQLSGEDWGNVALKLSTARPTLDSQVPDPTNWWLDFEYRQPVQSFRSMSGGRVPGGALAPAMAESIAQDKSMSLQAANVATAEVEDLGPATMFTVKRRADIPSMDQAQRVAIAHSEHPAALNLVVVPRLSPSAYLEAKITYGGESPLLPGPAQLFRDGDLAGQVQLVSTAPGQDFSLGFGMDERVTATRKRRTQKDGSAGLLGMKSRRAYDWDIKVSNFHEGDRDIEVREQLPKSRQDGIKVSGVELDPKAEAEDPQKPGLQIWKLKLKKGEEKKLRLRYEVRWPDDQRVTGLE